MNINRRQSEEWGSISFIILLVACFAGAAIYLAGKKIIIGEIKALNNNEHCVAMQVEKHQMPADCPGSLNHPTSKFALSLVHNTTQEERHKLAEAIFEKDVNGWKHGIFRAVHDESLTPDERVALFMKYFEYNTTRSNNAVSIYRNFHLDKQVERVRIIQSYEKSVQAIRGRADRFGRQCIKYIPLSYGVLSVISLIIFLFKRRPVSNETGFILNCLLVPLVPVTELMLNILTLIFLPHRTWLKGTFERRKLRKELGDDVLRFLDQIRDIKRKLRDQKIPNQKRTELEEELRGVEQEIEQLRQERIRMLKVQEEERTNTPVHQIGEEIETLGRQVTSTREIDRSTRMQTSSGLAIEFETIERQSPSKSNAG